MTSEKTFTFYIKKTHSSKYEKIMVEAKDSSSAINKLPRCVTWNFVIGAGEK